MDKQNKSVIKAVCLLLSFTLAVVGLSSCGKKGDEEEITRGSEPIVAPSVSQTQYHGEVTTDPAATKNRNTTAAETKADGSQETQAQTEPITFASEAENQAIQEAAKAGGVSADEVAQFVRIMGYDYDPKQGIFYTSYDNWQRQGNFVALYDTAAHYVNMNYKTARIDFGPCDGYNWRMQLWKGEYGVFGGCEAGIYTADPEKNSKLYTAVDDAHMLQWESALYLSENDYNNGNEWFHREWQSHWWLTGFKAGVVNSVVCLDKLRKSGFTGGKTIVKDYISAHHYLVPAPRHAVEPQRNRGRRYSTGPGEAFQMDWGFTKVQAYDGSEYNAACFAMICHHCGQRYVEFFPNAKQENLFIGMIHAFRYMGVPQYVLTDNTQRRVACLLSLHLRLALFQCAVGGLFCK